MVTLSESTICVSCALVAYDNGFENFEDRVMAMLAAGDICEDHICDKIEEPDIGIVCHCPGHRSG